MPSQAVSTALFPTIAAEQSGETARRSITPLVARNTLLAHGHPRGEPVRGGGAWLSSFSNSSSLLGASTGVVRTLAPGMSSLRPPASSATTSLLGGDRS